MKLQEKVKNKDEKYIGNLKKQSQKIKKAYLFKKCLRVYIDTLVTVVNGDRKTMQPIRITTEHEKKK